MIIDVPDVIAASIAIALQDHANLFRSDTKHSPEGRASLCAYADRLDAVADDIENRLEQKEADRRSAKVVRP